MVINDLFIKNLFRPINGVVKADQKEEAIVWQELDEYVVTKELDKLFRKFLSAYLNAIDNSQDPNITGKIGVWVSGFFGSGKSHFLKVLSYLLNNKEAHDPGINQRRKAAQFFESKVKDPMLLADIRRATSTDTDVILFNIDSHADSKDGKGAILSVFWRVFNELQGFCGDAPHVAEMERYLSEKGKYDEFCKIYLELTGDNWIDERDAYHFRKDEVIESLSKALGQSTLSATEWFEKAESNLSLTIDSFSKKVKEYLDKKGKNHRIVFLVDEVGQFIGNDVHLMLNLQTITEDLGRVCQGRAWVIVTSQEDIDAVLGDLKSTKANDFSKITGRFNTRLPLSSSNTDEVIQKRLLSKKKETISILEKVFLEKGDILQSQLSFSHDSASLKNFKDSSDFINNYPFAPYHFQLVQKIFESIRKAGATGLHLSRGERSMLDAFQSAAQRISSKPIGALVPLYEFYPSIESFLDTAVKRTIDNASENDGLEKPFDVHLLQTLFLIRYVDILKPNVDNFVTLFIDEVDADRLALKRNIEAGLQRLEKETLISRNGDLYYFLTNEERNVSREIKTVDISSTEEVKFLSEIIFAEILKDQNKHRYKAFKRDYDFNRLIDGHPYGSKIDQEISIEFISPFCGEYSSFSDTKCIMYTAEHSGRVLFKLGDNRELEREVRAWIQTDKYIRLKSDASVPPTFKEILRNRQEENRERKIRVTGILEKMILEAEVFALGQTLTLKTTIPKAAIEESLDYIVQNTFNKFFYLKTLVNDPRDAEKEIKSVLHSSDVGQQQLQMVLIEINPDAVKEIREHITLKVAKSQTVLLSELVEQFGRKPYGFPEWETLLLVARMFVAGEINLLMDGDSLEPRDAIEPMLKAVKRKTVKIIKRKVPSKEDVDKAKKICQDVFGKIGADVPDDLVKTIRQELQSWQKNLIQYKPLADTGAFPGKKEIDEALSLIYKIITIRDTYELLAVFIKKKEDLLDTSEDIHTLGDFYTNQKPTWEKLNKSLTEFKTDEAALKKNSETESALNRLASIASAPLPYSMLKDVETLIFKITAIKEQMLSQKREVTLQKMETKLLMVMKELERVKADNDFRNKVLIPLQTIKKRIGEERSIQSLSFHLEESVQAIEEAMETIENSVKIDDSVQPQKKMKSIRFSSLAIKSYMESPQDVEIFLEDLRAELLKELSDNASIHLQ